MKKDRKSPRGRDYYIKFVPKDFRQDNKVISCDAVTVGVHIKLMCVLADEIPKGKMKIDCAEYEPFASILLKQNDEQNDKQITKHLLQICSAIAPYFARFIQLTIAETNHGLIHLIKKGIYYIEDGYLCQKRMIRDFEISQKRAGSGAKGGKATQRNKKNEDLATKPDGEVLLGNLLKQKEEQIVNSLLSTINRVDNEGGIDNEYGGVGVRNSGGEKGEVEFPAAHGNHNLDSATGDLGSFQLTDLDLQVVGKYPTEFQEEWRAWREYATYEKNKPYKSVQAISAAVALLMDQASYDPVAAVKIMRRARQNTWATFFGLEGSPSGKNSPPKIMASSTAEIDAKIAAETDPEIQKKLRQEKYAIPPRPRPQ